jgi:hypothetical protein
MGGFAAGADDTVPSVRLSEFNAIPCNAMRYAALDYALLSQQK